MTHAISSFLRPPRPLRDPVERDPERQDGDRRDHALAELAADEPLGDLVAEAARSDEPADHDDGEHHDDPLVDAEHDRVAGERDLDLAQRLPPCRPICPGRLDALGRDVLQASLDEARDHGEGVEHGREDARHDRDRHQVDERDDVDELRQGLQHVVDRTKDVRDRAALRRPDPEAEPEDHPHGGGDENL